MKETENRVKKFGDLTAVDNLPFNLNQGEIFGIFGSNGAGKTTYYQNALLPDIQNEWNGKDNQDAGLGTRVCPGTNSKLSLATIEILGRQHSLLDSSFSRR